MPVAVPQKKGDPVFAKDEGIRADATAASMAALKPLMKDGVVTAGNSSQQNDAAACVVAEDRLADLGLQPSGFPVGWAAAAATRRPWASARFPAVQRLFAKTGLSWSTSASSN